MPIRLRGLLLLVVGVGLTLVAVYVVDKWLHEVRRGPILIVFPVVVAWIGWVELLTGLSLNRLGVAFERSIWSKLGLLFVVLGSPLAAIYVILRLVAEARDAGWF